MDGWIGCCGRKDERWIEDRIMDGRMVAVRVRMESRKDEGQMEGWGWIEGWDINRMTWA